MKKFIPQWIKNVYHWKMALLANVYFGFPARKIKVIGVTGTNGKTTTVQMITRILEEAGKNVAMASTINFKLGGQEWVNKTKFTTLSAWSVQKFISQAVKSGAEYLVLETSSHSLDQYRVWGVKYRTAVITNVTREHLDYHHTMEEYRLAKKKLFCAVQAAIVNLDMERPEEFLNCSAPRKIGYTLESKKVDGVEIIQAENVELGLADTKYQILNTKYQIHLLGDFNIENALAATCVGLSENISLETIKNALEKITGVPGRMESVSNDKGLNILIDYAVTPDSLEKLYDLIGKLRQQNNGKILAVFGSCGERDRGKRPLMGEIVAQKADYVFVTNEDPYNEDPQQIVDEVFAGVLRVKEKGVGCRIIMDRREAIRTALQMAGARDFVVVTGKGAEETMAIGKERIPWNDKQVISEELQKI
jgi:UDP-N-acetylmuramoyl-L-alanyl-D-glutamate--2,6-diaminopimelate ligase